LSKSPYGTFHQRGNVQEWNETLFTFHRRVRGGSFDSSGSNIVANARFDYSPEYEFEDLGFRVASLIPKPGSITLRVVGVIRCTLWRRMR
jgi:formylglycine-generating enzyme required for sulfatase activity